MCKENNHEMQGQIRMLNHIGILTKSVFNTISTYQLPFNTVIYGCAFVIAKLLCGMVDNMDINENQAEEEIANLQLMIKKFCQANDTHPLFKEATQTQ